MSLIVQKFGGTSVAHRRRNSGRGRAHRATKRSRQPGGGGGQRRGHKTDELIELAPEITDTPPAREMDMLLSTGEQESVALLAMAVQKLR